MDDQSRTERTPFNIQADFTEVDHSFRKRLNSLVPSQLSERIQEILSKKHEEEKKVQDG